MNPNADTDQILRGELFSESFSRNVSKMSGPFSKQHGFSAFQYHRVHNDGSCVVLCSTVKIVRIAMSDRAHVTAHLSENVVKDQLWNLVMPDGKYSETLLRIQETTGSTVFANFIQRFPDYYDQFCFWSPLEPRRAANQFLNLKSECERFAIQFRDQASELIKDATVHRFMIPPDMMPNLKGTGIASALDQSNQKVVEQAISLIEDDLFGAHTLSKIGVSVGCSVSGLIRKFKSVTRQSPYEYIRNRRLEEAMVLIQSRRCTVSEVAARVGYINFGAFSSAFKSKFGKPPSFFTKSTPLGKCLSSTKLLNEQVFRNSGLSKAHLK